MVLLTIRSPELKKVLFDFDGRTINKAPNWLTVTVIRLPMMKNLYLLET